MAALDARPDREYGGARDRRGDRGSDDRRLAPFESLPRDDRRRLRPIRLRRRRQLRHRALERLTTWTRVSIGSTARGRAIKPGGLEPPASWLRSWGYASSCSTR